MLRIFLSLKGKSENIFPILTPMATQFCLSELLTLRRQMIKGDPGTMSLLSAKEIPVASGFFGLVQVRIQTLFQVTPCLCVRLG